MKDLNAMLFELIGSKEMQEKLETAVKSNTVADFLKENDCDVKPEDFIAVLKKAAQKNKSEAMSADDMDAVAGGASLQEIRSKLLGIKSEIQEIKNKLQLMDPLMACKVLSVSDSAGIGAATAQIPDDVRDDTV